jgi:hypothetical protein
MKKIIHILLAYTHLYFVFLSTAPVYAKSNSSLFDNKTNDTTPPEVSISAPIQGELIRKQPSYPYKFKAETSDVESKIDKIVFYIDGKKIGERPAAHPEVNYNIKKVTDGKHEFLVTATDKAGNSTSVETFFYVGEKPPILFTFDEPQQGEKFKSLIPVSASITDADDVLRIEKVNYILSQNSSIVSVTTVNEFPYTTIIDIVEVPDGIFSISAQVVENNGIEYTSDAKQIEIDKTAPVITLNENNIFVNTAAFTIIGNVSDVNFKVLQIDGNIVSVDAQGCFSYPVTLSDGENSFELSASDVLGNACSETVLVTLDMVAPQMSQLTPENNKVLASEHVTLSGVITEEHPGAFTINSVPFTVNADNSFSVVKQLSEGENVFVFDLTDLADNHFQVNRAFYRDTISPELAITDPDVSPYYTSMQSYTINGTAYDIHFKELIVDNEQCVVTDTRFSYTTSLVEGDYSQ